MLALLAAAVAVWGILRRRVSPKPNAHAHCDVHAPANSYANSYANANANCNSDAHPNAHAHAGVVDSLPTPDLMVIAALPTPADIGATAAAMLA